MRNKRPKGAEIKRAPKKLLMHICTVRREPEGFAPESGFVCIYESARVEIP